MFVRDVETIEKIIKKSVMTFIGAYYNKIARAMWGKMGQFCKE